MSVAPAYLQISDLQSAVTTYDNQGVDFTQFDDAQLTNLIMQASIKIDGYCRQTFMETSVVEHYMGRGTNFLHLRKFPLWVGLQTTLAAPVSSGATSIQLASVSGLLPGVTDGALPSMPQGQLVNIVDPVNTNEPQNNIAASYTAGSTTVQLQRALALPHAAGTPVYVYAVDTIQVILPQQAFPIPSNVLVVQQELGIIQNYTPLMFQQLGYSTIFPKNVPLLVQYTYGYPAGSFPWELWQTCLELCISTVQRNAGLFMGGVSQVKSADQSITYFNPSQVSELNVDQKDRLIRFRRGRSAS